MLIKDIILNNKDLIKLENKNKDLLNFLNVYIKNN